MISVSNRLQETKEYYFSKKLREVAQLKKQGKPIINLGIGSPDLAPPKEVVEELMKATQAPGAYQYQAYKGLDELREAMCNFYETHYQVNVDQDQEVLPLMGSKEGIALISMAFLNEGDEVLVPNPGYPTYQAATKLLNARLISYDLTEDHSWHPDVEVLKKLDLSKVKLMWINYPNMPTGEPVNKQKLQELIQFAKANDILLVNDNPYSMVLTDEKFSIFQLEGAAEVSLELNSLSKSFNLAGFRVGFLVGNSEFISAVLKVKSNMDSGMFFPIQKAATKALNLDLAWFKKQNEIYKQRRAIVWDICESLDLTINRDAVSLFVWAKINSSLSAEALADELLYERDIFVTPGTVFGSNGANYVRFSLCVSEEDLKLCRERILKPKVV
ncbi:pyridoxal phosphate-dependent aminotransferase [Psychroflexus montanilacus]|uniref:pyridoxal phosphate-dependent aminotransferase n=1 Tax=Psychroflexus montanilacus TaxID=2873598 RepID=UPI001CC9B743|nr:aminotransferase class I/II-fold pyridoxal phosphate-dependent enzyme [Psychroflexus montanilacus]MBZ9652591.1 aminotransferase class I/II-fold pyridoxal phosphate-dependent enzyme [Psychroflexus montanilacus]